jgi:type I restriction enzyme S subunit
MNWSEINLGDVISLNYGKSLPAKSRDGGDYPVYGSNGVVGGHSEPLVKTEGIVVGRKGSFGEVQFSDRPFFPIDTTYYIDELYGMPVRYWFHLLRFLPLNQLNRATAIPGLNREDAYGLSIRLPPLAEQKAIAEKLDTLLAQVESTKARLERIPKILKRFRQSVLAAAVSGKLTEEWRKILDGGESAEALFVRWNESREKRFNDKQEELLRLGKIKRKKNSKLPLEPDLETSPPQEIPKNWKMVSVSQFAECLDSQRVPVKKADRITAKGIYPYFGANGEVDRVDDYIFDGDYVLVTEDETFYGREKPIAYRYTGKCWVNNHAHVLQAESKEANDYLCFSLMHYHILPWLSGTTGRAKLTQAALNSLPVGMPPEDELTEIVRRVDQLFAYADTIETQVNNALERVNNLTQSILAKAFRGELTEQWRKDNRDLISGENSAEALLEKIKAERAVAKPVKRGRKKA